MLRISRVVIISILIVTSFSLWGQNNTNSPYTRFGYGEIADRSFAAGRAMGGLGIGLRSSKQINPMNPASYTAVDSLTFIFEFGVHAQMSWYTDNTDKQHNVNGNLEYISLLFPIHKRVAMSAGLLPYSFVGYQFGETKEVGDLSYSEKFVGSGGLNELYAGLSVDIWEKRLALGANFGYLFGNMDHERNVVFDSSSAARNIDNVQRINVRDFKMEFGLQYTQQTSATDRFTLGATFSPANNLNSTSYQIQRVGDTSSGGYVEADTIKDRRFDLPNAYGIGITFNRNQKMTIGIDATYQEWSKAQFFSQSDYFKNRLRLAAGIEFIPDYHHKNFFKRVRYRGGVHYSNSYTQVDMNIASGVKEKYSHDEYGVSIGVGLPLRTGYTTDDNRSMINLALEYVKIKPEIASMIDEQYLRFTVNMTFNESWFKKLKIN